jgi:predicted metal-dependent HD superfamily phosphohydrolase
MLNIYKYQTGYTPSISLLLAIIGHDLVIDYNSENNEEASYDKLVSILRNNLQDITNLDVKKLIMATKHTELPDQASIEEKLIADLDLSILGTFSDHSWNKVYCDGIRAEASDISDEEFNKKRIAFLKRMLERKRIFITDVFYNLYEERARLNITRELEKLEAKQNA